MFCVAYPSFSKDNIQAKSSYEKFHICISLRYIGTLNRLPLASTQNSYSFLGHVNATLKDNQASDSLIHGKEKLRVFFSCLK